MSDGVEEISRAARKALLIPAQLADREGQAHDIRIRNISSTGLAAVIVTSLRVDDVVMVGLPGVGPVMAIVTRVKGKEIGVRFDCEIDADAVRNFPQTKKAAFLVSDLHRPAETHRRPGLKIR
jgi:hypothetical protein